MSSLYLKVQEAADYIKSKHDFTPDCAIILGTGLGRLADEIQTDCSIPYEEIPHFARTTVAGHAGNLIVGKLSGKTVVALDGRFHYYEGYTLEEVTFPVRVAKALGAEILLVSNAAGNLNPQWKLGDIMIIEDHINFMGVNPLVGPNDEKLGIRYPDMCYPYDPELMDMVMQIAIEQNIRAHTGVYIGVTGPCLETRAEYRMMRAFGADVVGMSTVPEVIVAVHSNMRVVGMSICTDMCMPDSLQPANIEEIIKTANEAEPKVTKLAKELLKKL